jgi:glycosyltransferase involved in cell wall biosynthesis
MASEFSVDMFKPRVSVIIPTLNEAANLQHVFAGIPEDVYEVILVDGRSVDNTVEVARELRPDIRVVMQTRKGKGNALACGFAAAKGDIIAMVDADGSADAGEIPRFVQALLDGADFAKGTRSGEGGGSADLTRIRSLGNWVLTTAFNVVYRCKYKDLCYGYNVFWRRHLPILDLNVAAPEPRKGSVAAIRSPDPEAMLWGDGFEIETLIHVRVAKSALKVTEVPSYEHSRIHGVSNLNAVRDGLRVLLTILTERRRTRANADAAAEAKTVPFPTAPHYSELLAESTDTTTPQAVGLETK